MKKWIPIYVLLFIQIQTSSSQTQNYLHYFICKNKAEVSIYKNEFQKALEYYDEAFRSVEFPLAKELYNATICASLTDNDSLMYLYFEKCMRKGVRFSFFQQNDTVFKKYFNHPKWINLSQQADGILSNYLSGVDNEYRLILDSIDREDQCVRKKITFFVRTFRSSKKSRKVFAEVRAIGVHNQKLIDSLIVSRGYPSEWNIGIGNKNRGALSVHNYVAFWHNVDSIFFHKVEYNALLKGELTPEYFTYKRHYMCCKNRLPCNYSDYINNKLTQNQIEHEDSIRKSIGYPTFEEEDSIIKFIKRTKNVYNFHFEIQIPI